MIRNAAPDIQSFSLLPRMDMDYAIKIQSGCFESNMIAESARLASIPVLGLHAYFTIISGRCSPDKLAEYTFAPCSPTTCRPEHFC
nr:hypothetical protein CFP56_08066 [Quercus suber]